MGVSRSCTGARFPGPGGRLGKKKETQSLSRKEEISASLWYNVEAHECAAGRSPDLSHFAGVTGHAATPRTEGASLPLHCSQN